MDDNRQTLPPPDLEEVFSTAIGTNMRTYITAGVGIVTMFLSGFNLIELNEKQITATTGALIFLAFIFTRLAIARGQKDSALAAQASVQTLIHAKQQTDEIKASIEAASPEGRLLAAISPRIPRQRSEGEDR
jgi:hypothetical protein